MPTIIVDEKSIEAKEGANLLETLLSAGLDVPYFCWHPAMGSIGACRQCAVIGYANDEDTRGRIVMSCMTPVMDGARFSVTEDKAASFRESVIENLMLNHPHDCPVCEEGGECHLQDMTVMVGHHDRQYEGLKTTFRNQYLGPFIGHEMNRCITCYRCVRYYQDYAGGHDLNAFGSRDRVFFGRAEPGVLDNEFAGNLIEVCPTGVFTDKTFSKHYTRKWDLQSAPTVCQGCSLGCNTYTSERYGEVRRVHNRYNHEVNGYFLCDRGRFGAQHVNSVNRVPQAGVRNEAGLYDPVNLEDALASASTLIENSKHLIGIGSPRASLEANEALRQLVGAKNYCNGMTDNEQKMHQILLDVLASDLNSPSLAEVEDYDAIIIVGEDVTNHAPRLALSIRQSVRQRASDLAKDSGIALWHDAAVRELAQNELSPLIILSPMADRLDDIAQESIRLAPAGIVDRVMQIASAADGSTPSSANEIAQLLINAKKPLIVSGTSLNSLDLLKAATNLAIAVTKHNPETGIFLCASESNSLGVCLLANDQSCEQMLKDKPTTAIVLENDIYQRFDHRVLESIEHLIVLTALDDETASRAEIVLPAGSFAEAQGTFINSEGRAQRSLAVFKSKGDVTPSYQLLTRLKGEAKRASHLQADLAASNEVFESIITCAPDESFRIAGSKIARMTHRSSGRTATAANISVRESRQPEDSESALAFTMEGNQQQAPVSLRAYTWSPRWNSNQSIHKFQSEVGGPDKTTVAKSILFHQRPALTPYPLSANTDEPQYVVGQHHIFGSDPISNEAEELASLAPTPYAKMNTATALSLGLIHRSGVKCHDVEMIVLIEDDVADGCLIYPLIRATSALAGAAPSDFITIDNWVTPENVNRESLITTDGTR
ncbi:MAG: NADH-quinone oxidoreductase subunit G [Candidatus Azotimanducaceae bacterium]|jgi:NADH-quinone oxidoreductase subunit G